MELSSSCYPLKGWTKWIPFLKSFCNSFQRCKFKRTSKTNKGEWSKKYTCLLQQTRCSNFLSQNEHKHKPRNVSHPTLDTSHKEVDFLLWEKCRWRSYLEATLLVWLEGIMVARWSSFWDIPCITVLGKHSTHEHSTHIGEDFKVIWI